MNLIIFWDSNRQSGECGILNVPVFRPSVMKLCLTGSIFLLVSSFSRNPKPPNHAGDADPIAWHYSYKWYINSIISGRSFNFWPTADNRSKNPVIELCTLEFKIKVNWSQCQPIVYAQGNLMHLNVIEKYIWGVKITSKLIGTAMNHSTDLFSVCFLCCYKKQPWFI